MLSRWTKTARNTSGAIRALFQDSIPDKIQMAKAYGKNLGIKQIEASNQFSAAVTEDSDSTSGATPMFSRHQGFKKEYQGNIDKVALTTRAYIALTKDGAVVYSGFQKDNALVRIPDGLSSGVVDLPLQQCGCRRQGRQHGRCLGQCHGQRGQWRI